MADDTDGKLALKLLLREWKLEFPRLLISVTGGAKTFKLPEKLKQLFRQGLFKVSGGNCPLMDSLVLHIAMR